MNKGSLVAAFAILASFTASPTWAQSYNYSVRQFSDATATTETAVTFSTSNAVNVSVLSSTVRIRILAQGTGYDIGRVTLSSSSEQATLTMISVGNAFSDYDTPVSVPTGNSWRGLEVSFETFPNAVFYGGITGNLTGDVVVPGLRRLQIGGVIEAGADVFAHSRTESDPFVIFASSVSATSPIPRFWLNEGDIDRVQTASGNMGGEVRAVHGSIKNVVVAGDLTGRVLAVGGKTSQSTPDTTVVARIENISVGGDITSQPFAVTDINDPNFGGWPSGESGPSGLAPIRAQDGIYAVVADAITANFVAGGSVTPSTGTGDGLVRLFQTLTGDFSGFLALGAVEPSGVFDSGVLIAGDLTGTIFVRCRTPQCSETIRIGGSLASTGSIIFDEGASVTSGVIINGNNEGGEWLGTVQLGETTAGCFSDTESTLADVYPTLPSSIGGGAVGLVPFALHDEASFPAGLNSTPGVPTGSQVLFADDFSAGSGEVRLKFYGPIRVADVDPQHPEYTIVNLCQVNRAFPSECGGLIPLMLTAAVDQADPTVLVVSWNSPNFPLIPGKYRMTPGERLLCDLGLGPSDPAVRTSSPAYEFYLADCGSSACISCGENITAFPLCFLADFDASGGVDGDDVIAFFDEWDAGHPGADVNLDFAVDGDDAIHFFCWWDNGGC